MPIFPSPWQRFQPIRITVSLHTNSYSITPLHAVLLSTTLLTYINVDTQEGDALMDTKQEAISYR